LGLTVGSDADIKGVPLCDELNSFQIFVKKLKNPTPLNILNFIKTFNMESCTLMYRFLQRIVNHASFCSQWWKELFHT
jgi:hypothetical protein